MSRVRVFFLIVPVLLTAGMRVASAQAPATPYGADCPLTSPAASDLVRETQALGPDHPKALHCFARAAAKAAEANDPATEAAARLGFAGAAHSQALYAIAEPEAKSARTLSERLGDAAGVARAERMLGSITAMIGDRAAARRLLASAQRPSRR